MASLYCPIELHPGEGFTEQRTSIYGRHLNNHAMLGSNCACIEQALSLSGIYTQAKCRNSFSAMLTIEQMHLNNNSSVSLYSETYRSMFNAKGSFLSSSMGVGATSSLLSWACMHNIIANYLQVPCAAAALPGRLIEQVYNLLSVNSVVKSIHRYLTHPHVQIPGKNAWLGGRGGRWGAGQV